MLNYDYERFRILILAYYIFGKVAGSLQEAS